LCIGQNCVNALRGLEGPSATNKRNQVYIVNSHEKSHGIFWGGLRPLCASRAVIGDEIQIKAAFCGT